MTMVSEKEVIETGASLDALAAWLGQLEQIYRPVDGDSANAAADAMQRTQRGKVVVGLLWGLLQQSREDHADVDKQFQALLVRETKIEEAEKVAGLVEKLRELLSSYEKFTTDLIEDRRRLLELVQSRRRPSIKSETDWMTTGGVYFAQVPVQRAQTLEELRLKVDP